MAVKKADNLEIFTEQVSHEGGAALKEKEELE